MSSDDRPPWVDPDAEPPDTANFSSIEIFVAGALSQMKPFSAYHPGWALPFGAEALRAIGQWMPDEDATSRLEDAVTESCDDPWHKMLLRKRARKCPSCDTRERVRNHHERETTEVTREVGTKNERL